jgi:predicted nucleic acid-binding protein
MSFSNGMVLDTSVWINLLATGRAWEIVSCFGTKCMAAQQVVCEVQRDPISQRPYDVSQHPLRGRADVEIIDLSGPAIDHFFSLVGRDSLGNLGDGEAATIAIAATRGCAIGLDERKARRIVRERFSSLLLISSFELLRLPSVERTLGTAAIDEAIADASRYGRMHSPKDLLAGTRPSRG